MGLRLSLESCGYGVGVTVGAGVAVNVAVGVGALRSMVIVPSCVISVSDVPAVSHSETPDRARGEVPALTVANQNVAKASAPVGPGWLPVVLHPNVTLLKAIVGAGHVTVRPVEPRKAPLVTLT